MGVVLCGCGFVWVCVVFMWVWFEGCVVLYGCGFYVGVVLKWVGVFCVCGYRWVWSWVGVVLCPELPPPPTPMAIPRLRISLP